MQSKTFYKSTKRKTQTELCEKKDFITCSIAHKYRLSSRQFLKLFCAKALTKFLALKIINGKYFHNMRSDFPEMILLELSVITRKE